MSMRTREYALAAIIGATVMTAAACSTFQSIVSDVAADEPAVAADVQALCAAEPAVASAANTVLKGGALTTAQKTEVQIEQACGAATATAPTVAAALATIEATTAANQTLPAATGQGAGN
jgi:hypothetical protein